MALQLDRNGAYGALRGAQPVNMASANSHHTKNHRRLVGECPISSFPIRVLILRCKSLGWANPLHTNN